MVRSAVVLLCFCIFAGGVVAPSPGHAGGTYTPPGLYEVERLRLANGFQVILKQRAQVHTVSLRLVVNLGSRHFDCGHRETPHFIEHLLFSGTSQHTESQLDRLIEGHGGTWNAETGTRSTVYQVDIFDQYAAVALDTLYEIVTDTEFSPDKMRMVSDIIEREAGGRPTAIRRALYQYDIGKTAWKQANEWLLPGEGVVCSDLTDPGRIDLDGLIRIFRQSYVPGNMTLILVGNFDRALLVERVRMTYGRLAQQPVPSMPIISPPYPSDGPKRVRSTFAPFLGSSAHVGVAYRTAGRDSSDGPALTVLGSYLHRKIYEQLRVESGLSYAPEAVAFLQPDYGVFYMSADTNVDTMDQVRELIERSIEQIGRTPPSAEEVERTKQKILLQWVQGYETNGAMADYYADSLPDIARYGHFRNYERDIEGVTAADVRRIIAVHMRKAHRVEVLAVPTMTYTQFFLVIGASLAAGAIVVTILIRRAVARRRSVPWYRR